MGIAQYDPVSELESIVWRVLLRTSPTSDRGNSPILDRCRAGFWQLLYLSETPKIDGWHEASN